MLGAGIDVTVNDDPLLANPPTTAKTFPVLAPVGTGATIDVALQLFGEAVIPLKVRALAP